MKYINVYLSLKLLQKAVDSPQKSLFKYRIKQRDSKYLTNMRSIDKNQPVQDKAYSFEINLFNILENAESPQLFLKPESEVEVVDSDGLAGSGCN